jgi:probable HAF family extracellular repeat protein
MKYWYELLKRNSSRAVISVLSVCWAVHQGVAQVSIVEIPSLGGGQAEAQAVNNAGAVAGFSSTAVRGQQHAFLFTGTNLDVGTLGGRFSQGWDVNQAGHVAGQSSLLGDREQHGFLFRNGQLTDLGTLGGTLSMAVSLNDAGHVVGSSADENGEWRAFLWANGELMNLGTLGGTYSAAVDVNEAGQVVGQAFITEDLAMRAFLHSDGVMVDLGTLGGWESYATAINAAGMVVGDSGTTNGPTHAFLYANGEMHDLGTLGGSYSTATGVNDAGQVIGEAVTAGDMDSRGFLYHNGVMTDLGSLGSGWSSAWDINNRGQVVGDSYDASGNMRAYVWENGVMQDLNTLLPTDSGWNLLGATMVNDMGQIVGFGIFNGRFAQYLLTLKNPNTDPVADAGSDVGVECSGSVVLDASASSDPDGDDLTYQWSANGVSLGSGAQLAANFGSGVHNVHLVVTDSHGASAQDDMVVTVADVTVPVIVCPEPVRIAVGANCVAELPDFVANLMALDNCEGPLVGTQTPGAGSQVSLGNHVVTLVVTDVAGNHGTCSVVVTVVDEEAPVITSLSATPSVLQPANKAMVPVQVSVTATDNCDSAPVCRIVSIISSDPITGQGDNTAPDFRITGPLTAEVRAERAKTSRVYTITIECRDAAGNVSARKIFVSVPKGNDKNAVAESKVLAKKVNASKRNK